MHISEIDYVLPKSLIAQKPAEERDKCKLLIYNRNNDNVEHKYFFDIINFIKPDDVLIFNNTKVFSARFFGLKNETNAKIEFLLLKKLSDTKWESLIKPLRRVREGTIITILDRKNKLIDISVEILEKKDTGESIIQFSKKLKFDDFYKFGYIPLPPYIKRTPDNEFDKKYYQTVYAEKFGAVAAPTAGFHFTNELINRLKLNGVKVGFITLHIGWDTFAPIKEDIVEKHKIHKEFVIVPDETAELINNKKGRCIAVGTTVVRALESAAVENGKISPISKFVDTFILPNYKIKIVDSLITNFHLPKSTLLLLVSAFTGLDKLKYLYNIAIENKYKFYSYGDAMFII